MAEAKINFAEIPWDEASASVRSKAVVRSGKKLRLVEFTHNFVERDWCIKAHAGYVLDGEMVIMFPDGAAGLTAGDGIFISGGEVERHKAIVISSVVRLILVEDA